MSALLRKVILSDADNSKIIEVATLLAKANTFYTNQKSGIYHLLKGRNIADISSTGTGKTVLAAVSLLLGIKKRSMSVYLAPTSTLRDMNAGRIAKAIDEVYGPNKPMMMVLNKYIPTSIIRRGKLIVFSTPEKFLGEYEKLRLTKEFHKKRFIGSVVLDEAHILGDPSRGGLVEVLLRMLKAEQNPQIVFLSATFPGIEKKIETTGKSWLDDFQLVLVDRYIKKRKISRTLRLWRDVNEKQNMLKEDLVRYLKSGDKYDKRLSLVFVSKRETADRLSEIIHKSIGVNTVSIHAYKGIVENREALNKVLDWKRGVIFSTTILEPGIDIDGIEQIIFYDAESPIYEGLHFVQGEGRSRACSVEILLYAKVGSNLTWKMVVEPDLSVQDYILRDITTCLRRDHLLRILMNYVAIGFKTKRDIIKFFKEKLGIKKILDRNYYGEIISVDVDDIIEELIEDNPYIFSNDGWIRLTEFGRRLLLAQINPIHNNLFNHEYWNELDLTSKIVELYKLNENYPVYNLNLLLDLLIETNLNFESAAKKIGLPKGLIEGERKKIAWLATALKQITDDENELKKIENLLKKVRTYPPPKRYARHYRHCNTRKNSVDTIKNEILKLLKENKDGLSVSRITELLGNKYDWKTVYNVLYHTLLKKNIVKRVRIVDRIRGTQNVLFFLSESEIPEYVLRKCNECLFFTRVVHKGIKHNICMFHRVKISEKGTACKEFHEKVKRYEFTIDSFEFGSQCRICGSKMNGEALCRNCGTLYILKRNGKFRVIPGDLDVKRKILSQKGKKINSLAIEYPIKIRRCFTIHLSDGDNLNFKNGKLYLKIKGMKKSIAYAPELLRAVVLENPTVRINKKILVLLHSLRVPIYYSGKLFFSDEALKIRNILKNLDLTHENVKLAFTSKVIIELFSAIYLMRLISNMFEVCERYEIYEEAITSWILRLALQYINGDINERIARSYEGLGKRAMWYYVAKVVGPDAGARVISRFISSKFRYFTRSPFHATLNYFYRLLTTKMRESFAENNMFYYNAGPGLLHRHSTIYSTKSDGLLFDTVDMFRPIFILETVKLWLNKELCNDDFLRFRIPALGYIYAPSDNTSEFIYSRFKSILNRKYNTYFGVLRLGDALKQYTAKIKDWILNYKNASFPLFLLSTNYRDMVRVNNRPMLLLSRIIRGTSLYNVVYDVLMKHITT